MTYIHARFRFTYTFVRAWPSVLPRTRMRIVPCRLQDVRRHRAGQHEQCVCKGSIVIIVVGTASTYHRVAGCPILLVCPAFLLLLILVLLLLHQLELARLGRLEQAATEFGRIDALVARLYGVRDPRLHHFRAERGELLISLGRFPEAEKVLLENYRWLKKRPGGGMPRRDD